MYKNGKYRETDKMSDLICENYPMVLVMSRFGLHSDSEKRISEKYAAKTVSIPARS